MATLQGARSDLVLRPAFMITGFIWRSGGVLWAWILRCVKHSFNQLYVDFTMNCVWNVSVLIPPCCSRASMLRALSRPYIKARYKCVSYYFIIILSIYTRVCACARVCGCARARVCQRRVIEWTSSWQRSFRVQLYRHNKYGASLFTYSLFLQTIRFVGR